MLFRLNSTPTLLTAGFLLVTGLCPAAEPITLPPNADFSILPPPPANDSPAGLADLSVLLYVQANRTPEQVKIAEQMQSPSVFAMAREILGDSFRRENLPKTADILGQTSKAATPVLQGAKKHWHRLRPFMRSPLISPVVDKPNDAGSYPSGHTFGMALPMFLLSAAFPGHEDAFDEKIHRVMWGRIVGGVHFPSDTEAGRLLAKDVMEKLLQTPAMKAAIETIREEAAPFISKEPAKASGPQAK